jgi:hypothetical protein
MHSLSRQQTSSVPIIHDQISWPAQWQRRRAALSPECDYRETMARLAGHLAGVPWARRWHVPTSKVFTGWRRLLGWQVMEQLFWQAAGPVAGPAAPHGQATLWCGRELCAIDGFQTDLPATGANRKEFGSSGTSDGSGPFPQARRCW